MSRGDGSRLVLMIVAVGMLVPLHGGIFLAVIAACVFGFYAVGILYLTGVRLLPSHARDDYDWVRGLSVAEVTNYYLIDIAPWIFIGCGVIVAVGRVIVLARGVWIK